MKSTSIKPIGNISNGLNRVIEDFNSLVLEEKEFALEIIRKMFIEAHREFLLKRAHTAISNYSKGKVKYGTAKDLYKDLEND